MNTQPIWVLLYFATWPKYTPIPGCPVSFQEFDPTKFLIRNASEKISHHLIPGTKTSLAWYKDKNIQNLRQRRIPCNCYVDGKGSGFQAAQRSVSSGRVSLLPSAPSPRSSRRCFHPQPPHGQFDCDFGCPGCDWTSMCPLFLPLPPKPQSPWFHNPRLLHSRLTFSEDGSLALASEDPLHAILSSLWWGQCRWKEHAVTAAMYMEQPLGRAVPMQTKANLLAAHCFWTQDSHLLGECST